MGHKESIGTVGLYNLGVRSWEEGAVTQNLKSERAGDHLPGAEDFD